ncbi:MAG TPA: hypothetical protein VN837_16805 [Chloroflexota bacterium]|nr:hypothetical protein [Chloroflexota bacterium]
MNKLQYVGAMLGTAALALGTLGATAPVGAHRATGPSYTFTSIASQGDPTFTQLLGISKSGVIAGYFGSGADAQHPNKGFMLTLPNTSVAENYPNSVQTQVIGINNSSDTDGFYIDAKGVTHGFTDIKGVFATVDVPGTTFNQLLGINNNGAEVGYYQYGPSSAPIFVPYEREADGSFLLLPIANAQATTLNDHGLVGGFYNDSAGNAHGFLWQSGVMKTINYHHAVSTQILGVNNLGLAVGTYTDSKKVSHGFTYDTVTKTFTRIDAPGSSATVVNGVNRLGWLVGFYTAAGGSTNGNTIGFVAKPNGQ